MPRAHPLALACLLVLAPNLRADRVVTEDGRVLEVLKAREKDGGYLFEFEHGTIFLPTKAGVKAVEVEGDMSDYVPENDDERKKLEQGYVRYRGKWISKVGYLNKKRKEHERSKAQADEMAVYSRWLYRLKTETKHFFIETNTSPELLEYYAELFEAYYKLMDKRVGIKPTPTMRRTKMTVNIYKNRPEFTKMTRKSPGVAGFFHPGEQTLNFFHDYVDPTTSDWVALHECTHLLTYLIDQQFRPQIWINEAVADYFGSATIERDRRGKLVITPGKLQIDRVLTVQQALQKGEAVRLGDLFELERRKFHSFEYAHAWSFVYFLNNYKDGKYAKGFAKFFRDLYTTAKGVPYETIPSYGLSGVGKVVKPEDIKALLLKRIGERDVQKLERQWHDFIAEIPVDAPEARLKRGLRAVAQWKFGAALPDLEAAIEGGVEDARAYWARARAITFKGHIVHFDEDGEELPDETPETEGGKELSSEERQEQALADIRRAIELDPLNARYRRDLSFYLVADPDLAKSFIENETTKESIEHGEAKEQAGLAMELDPKIASYRTWYESFK